MAKAKYTRQKDGYFQTKVWDGTYTSGGTKHYVTLRSAKSSRDLERMAEEYRSSVKERKLIRNTNITFWEYARTYVKTYKANKAANTQAMYSNIVEKHFRRLEGILLQDITRVHYMAVFNGAQGHPRTQQQIKMVFKQVLESAAADQLLSAAVVGEIMGNVEQVKYRSPEKRPLTKYERQAVFAADLAAQDRVFLLILYGCGLRRSEALALTTFDIDLKSRNLTVNKAFEFTRNNPCKKVPKSENGYRTVPVPDKIYPDVERYVLRLRSSGQVNLFTMRNGKPVSKSSYDKMWARIIRAMQAVCNEPITGLTAHVFRHNYCTNLCYQIPKVSIKKIAELLGDSERMVLDVYNHIILEKEDAANAVNAAIEI